MGIIWSRTCMCPQISLFIHHTHTMSPFTSSTVVMQLLRRNEAKSVIMHRGRGESSAMNVFADVRHNPLKDGHHVVAHLRVSDFGFRV